MTKEQIYHRRLARKYGHHVIGILRGRVDADYRGKGSLYEHAQQSAWHAFKAHPELREPEGNDADVNSGDYDYMGRE